jgi:dipeptidyl aminopeptidase/acylaminoacyl peptidase
MHSRERTLKTALATLSLLLALPLTGCAHATSEVPDTIPPASATPGTDLGLGPGVRPLSLGPGDKSSPRISPTGERVAFVLDGYVAEKPLRTQSLPHSTSNGPGAEQAEWLPDGNLATLRPEDETAAESAGSSPTPSALFAAPPDGSSNNRMLLGGILAAGALPQGEPIVVAVAVAPATDSSGEQPKSRLVLVRDSEQPMKVYLRHVDGAVTGLSVSPDGQEAALAVRRDTGEAGGRFEIQTYRFSEGQPLRVARLPKGEEILGAPQWTPRGIHFVAGEAGVPGARDTTAPHSLYRVSEGSETPEPVRGIGEDFVAGSISVSPDGDRLAIVGRRNPGSPTNLYVLDLTSETLEAATTNQNMEIKTNPRDLAWLPDGRSVIVIARGVLSGPEVYDAAADTLSSAFYNLYEVPVTDLPAGEKTEE